MTAISRFFRLAAAAFLLLVILSVVPQGLPTGWIVDSRQVLAAAAVAFDAAANSGNISNQTSATWSHTVSSNADRYLVVGLSGFDSLDTISNVIVSYNGVSMSKLGGQQSGGNNQAVLWGLVNPAPGTHSVTVTNIPSGFAELGGGSVSFTGVNQVTPTGTLVNGGFSASVNISLATGDMGVDILYAGGSGAAPEPTAGANETKRVNSKGPAPSGNQKWFMMGTEAGSGIVNMSWSGIANDNAIAAVPLKASGSSPDTLPPSTPGNLTASPFSSVRIDLSWSASADDVGVALYSVERCQGVSCSGFVQIATSTVNSYADSSTVPSTVYRYRVRALDAAGNASGYSNTAEATTPAAPAETFFYVSPTGNDANPGTQAAPFLTVERARAVVRTMRGNMSGNINVLLRGGEYPLSATLAFDQDDSGTNGFNVLYKAYPGEKPVITGGQRLTGWVAVGGGLYKASAGGRRFRQLYVNESKAVRSREPDGGENSILNWDIQGSRIGITANQISNWQAFNEVEMIHQKIMGQMIYRLGSYSVSGNTAWVVPAEPERTKTFSSQGYPFGLAGQPFHFENAYEFLDTPGEWYLKTATDEVFYMPRAGEDLSTANIVVPNLETLVRVQGTLDNPAHHIQFYGITFQYSTYTLPSTEGHIDDGPGLSLTNALPNDQITSYPGKRLPAAFYLEAADNIRIERSTFAHLGAGGVLMYLGAHDDTVVGNVFQDIAGSAVSVDMNLEGNPTDARKISRRDVVSNNYIYEVAQSFGVAIHGGYVDSMVVEHNEIAHTPYTGILMGWGWADVSNAATNNKIRYNDITRAVEMLSDGGAIYTLSRQPGTLIVENYVHDVPHVFPGGYGNNGVFLDEGSNYITVQDNVFVNIPDGDIRFNGNGCCNSVNYNGGASPATIANAGLEPAYEDIRPVIAPPSSDTTPPVLFSGQPSGTLPAGTTQTTLSLTSDEAATCRYTTVPGTAYQSMTNTFSTTGGTQHNTAISGLSAGSYSFYVRCQDATGNRNTTDFVISFSISSGTVSDTEPPSAPAGLTGTPVSSSQVNLSWVASADNVGIAGYRLERCQGSSCVNFVQIATPAGTSYSDAGLAASTTYRYQVRAVDGAGNTSAYSSVASASTPAVTAAVAFDAAVNSPNLSNKTSGSWSHTTTGTNRYLVVGLAGWDNNSSIGNVTVTYNGVAMTRLGGTSTSGMNQAVLWGLVNPAVGAHTVSVTNIPSGFAELGGGSVSFSGVNQTTSTGAIASSASASAVNISLATGDLGLDILYDGQSGTAISYPTPGANETMRVNTTFTKGGGRDYMMMGTKAGTGTTPMTWTGHGDHAIAAVPIKR